MFTISAYKMHVRPTRRCIGQISYSPPAQTDLGTKPDAIDYSRQFPSF